MTTLVTSMSDRERYVAERISTIADKTAQLARVVHGTLEAEAIAVEHQLAARFSAAQSKMEGKKMSAAVVERTINDAETDTVMSLDEDDEEMTTRTGVDTKSVADAIRDQGRSEKKRFDDLAAFQKNMAQEIADRAVAKQISRQRPVSWVCQTNKAVPIFTTHTTEWLEESERAGMTTALQVGNLHDGDIIEELETNLGCVKHSLGWSHIYHDGVRVLFPVGG